MAIIPVVLQLSDVAQNYNLCLTLTTPGVVWSLGEGGDDYLGISFNSLTLGDKRKSSIQRLEFTGSTLAICTAPTAGSDFTLTAFIDVPDNVEWLQGYCILNEKARVLARLGDLPPVEWQDEINCVIPILLPDIHRATFTVRGVAQGQTIRIHLAGDGSPHGGARWCVAPLDNPDIGLTVKSSRDDVALPIGRFCLDEETIELTIVNPQKGSGQSADLIVEAYIQRIGQCRYWPPLANVRMKAECDEHVTVIARVGGHAPQYLAPASKLFAL